LGHSGRAVVVVVTDIYFVKKENSLPLQWMPPFKNGEHNSQSASTLDSDIDPSKKKINIANPLSLPLCEVIFDGTQGTTSLLGAIEISVS